MMGIALAVLGILMALNAAATLEVSTRPRRRAPLPPPLPPPQDPLVVVRLVLDAVDRAQERQLAALADAIAKSTAAVNVPASNLPPPPPSGSPGPVTWYDQQLPDDRDPTDFYLPSDSRLEGAVIDGDEPFGIPGLRREGVAVNGQR